MEISHDRIQAVIDHGDATPAASSEGIDRFAGITAAELAALEFPEPKWVIPGIIPEGATLLAAKPKHGKSFMAYSICLAVAAGGKAFGKVDVEAGTALYLALEDTRRRLKHRLFQILPKEAPAPENLILFDAFPRMGAGGIKRLKQEIERHHDARFVVIDTLKKFKPPSTAKRSGNSYDEDYEPIDRIKAVADECGVGIMVVHHLRKSEADDIFDTVSGSLGLTGAADHLMIMQRRSGQADAVLHIHGRDVEPAELALKFDSESFTWHLLGDASEVRATERQQQLYDTVRLHSGDFSPMDLIRATGFSNRYVHKQLAAMVGRGEVRKRTRGKYEYIQESIV